jgi:uncharacterized linocin/CFP29 family protein
MSDQFLQRKDAPISEKTWGAIDQAVVGAATSQLSGRRLIKTQGPYGLGLKALHSPDAPVNEKTASGAKMTASRMTPLVMIRSSFTLAARDIAAFEQSSQPLDLNAVAKAAMDCARQEDNLLFYGSKAVGLKGLLNAEGSQSAKLKPWTKIGTAADDVLRAVKLLDKAGFYGPYVLALSVDLYNLLFRRYPQGSTTEFEHLKQFVTDGIIKAPTISAGGIVLCTSGPFAQIVLGQDLMTGFIGPCDNEYEFAVSESVTLRLTEPAAICVLKQ